MKFIGNNTCERRGTCRFVMLNKCTVMLCVGLGVPWCGHGPRLQGLTLWLLDHGVGGGLEKPGQPRAHSSGLAISCVTSGAEGFRISEACLAVPVQAEVSSPGSSFRDNKHIPTSTSLFVTPAPSMSSLSFGIPLISEDPGEIQPQT